MKVPQCLSECLTIPFTVFTPYPTSLATQAVSSVLVGKSGPFTLCSLAQASIVSQI